MGQSSSGKFRQAAGILSKIVLAVLWISILALCLSVKDDFTLEEILRYTPENPWLAAAMLLGLFALKSLTVVFPSGILYAASGVLFSLPVALLVNAAGSVLMFTLPYGIGRAAGTSAVSYIYEKYPKAKTVQQMRLHHDFSLALLLRLVGILPLDVVSLYMGAIQVQYGGYLLGSLVGVLPSLITYPVMGMAITDPTSLQFLISLCIQILFRAVSVGSYAVYRRRNTSARRDKNAGKDTEPS